MKRIRIWFLRRKLRRKYSRLSHLQDEYDCGRGLADYLNPEMRKLRKEVDELFTKLRLLEGGAGNVRLSSK